jgi:uncharacterized protein YkwD
MRISWSTPALLVALCALIVLPSAGWPQSASNAERQLYEAANRERQSHGLASLTWNEALADAARKHALEMAKHGSVSHQFSGEPNLPTRARLADVHYSWLAENVDQGPSAATIHQRFMASPLHHANILDTDMNSVGIGMAERDGQWFAVEDFAKTK